MYNAEQKMLFRQNISLCRPVINRNTLVMNAKGAILTATFYLAAYIYLFATEALIEVLALMFLVSPFLIAGMVYMVLKDTRYKYPELNEGEEWGYRDKAKPDLGVF